MKTNTTQAVTDAENEKFSRDVSNFKGSDPEATRFAIEQFLQSRTQDAAQPTTLAPGPVAQGEGWPLRESVHDVAKRMYAQRPTFRGTKPLSWSEAPNSVKREWLDKATALYATPAPEQATTGSGQNSGSVHSGSGECGNVQAPTIGPREIAKFLRGVRGMGCNCDLDSWEPERSTGHSHVCRIHKAAIAADSALKAEVSAAILSTASPAGEGEVKA